MDAKTNTMLKSSLEHNGKVTHVEIGDSMIPIETISDDMLIFALCGYDALIQSWEKQDRVLVHEKYFYIGNINALKIEREKTCDIVNKILVQRDSMYYPLEKKYGYITYAIGYVKYGWYWIIETIPKKLKYIRL